MGSDTVAPGPDNFVPVLDNERNVNIENYTQSQGSFGNFTKIDFSDHLSLIHLSPGSTSDEWKLAEAPGSIANSIDDGSPSGPEVGISNLIEANSVELEFAFSSVGDDESHTEISSNFDWNESRDESSNPRLDLSALRLLPNYDGTVPVVFPAS